MVSWERHGQIGSHAARQRLLTRLLVAARAMPWNAEYRTQLAHFYTWHAHAEVPNSARQRLFVLRAREWLEDVLVHRPAWGYAWALLAENHSLGAMWAPASNRLLDRAVMLGPFEPGTLKKVAMVGMGRWSALDEAARRTVRTAMSRALNLDPRPLELVRAAVGLDWASELDPLLHDADLRARFQALVARQGR